MAYAMHAPTGIVFRLGLPAPAADATTSRLDSLGRRTSLLARLLAYSGLVGVPRD